jgi:non-canonical (house-cleaning) NTP pyrophosphatase
MGSATPKIIVAVGTSRKPKLNAVSEALDAIKPLLAPSAEFQIEVREVPSGVSHTPSSREELMRGARQRAEALISVATQLGQHWNYFVGLEGGLDVIHENGQRRVFLESWAYVTNGTLGIHGRSGAVEIPEALASEVLDKGIELGVAIDTFAGERGVRDAQGAWGVLTSNQITRQSAFVVALVAAFAPFYNSVLYRPAIAVSRSSA